MANEFNQFSAISIDASRFDQHVSLDALRWEHSVYLTSVPYGERKFLSWLLKQQLVNTGTAWAPDGRVRYRTRGCRMSGDMNTSMGNCLLMCGMVHAMMTRLGVRARLACNGDDCVIFVEKHHEGRVMAMIPDYFRNLGFTMKVEQPVHVIEHIDFCQTRPVCVAGEWRMVRNPRTALSKDLTLLQPGAQGRQVLAYSLWMSAVGKCGSSISSGVPVFQSFYQWMVGGVTPTTTGNTWAQAAPTRLRPGRGKQSATTQGFGVHGGLQYMSQGMTAALLPICPTTRLSFWLAWGITPDCQIEFERSVALTSREVSCVGLISDREITGTLLFR
jgi:hypothetical protein